MSIDTSLHRNAFWLLRATPRDNRKRIVDLAEEMSLHVDHHACQKAKSALTNPRARLVAEIGWLPGVSPRRAAELAEQLLVGPASLFEGEELWQLPKLAGANVYSAVLETLDAGNNPDKAADVVMLFTNFVDAISIEDVMRDINEDRAIASFGEALREQVETELVERKIHYREIAKTYLDRLPSTRLIDVMTAIVNEATEGGKIHAPWMIDELVDSYEVDAQGFFQKETENIRALITVVKSKPKSDWPVVGSLIDKLEVTVRNWDRVAQPIQLSMKARGITHALSYDVGREIRSLAVDLFNKNDMLAHARRLTNLLKELFSELHELDEKVDEDIEALNDIEASRGVEELLSPITALCEAVTEAVDREPSSAWTEGQKLLAKSRQLLVNLARSTPPKAAIEQANDRVALTLMHCAVAFGNKTEKWASCITLLEASLKCASSVGIKEKVEKNLEIVRKNDKLLSGLTPISSAPSLYTINGIGCTLYGSTDHDPETHSYIATYYFVFLAIPIFPICRYRVINELGMYRFLGKAPLRTFDKWHIAISTLLLIWMFSSMNGSDKNRVQKTHSVGVDPKVTR